MPELKFLKLEEVVEAVSRSIAHYRYETHVYDQLHASVFAQWEGKVINKRIRTDAQKVLGDEVTIHYSKEYETYRLSVWGNDRDYSDRMSIVLGRIPWASKARVRLSLEYIRENNLAYEYAKDRSELLKRRMSDLPEAIAQFNEAIQLYHLASAIGEKEWRDKPSVHDYSVHPLSSIFRLSQSTDWKKEG